MFVQGNFALLSLPGLLQLLCQEQRSVELTAYRGSAEAQMRIHEGMIVFARCGTLTGAEAVHQLAVWESGQFEITPLDALPDEVELMASWEALMLEAARQRDELELQLEPLPESPGQGALDALLQACPAVASAALVSRDGRLLASAGLDDALAAITAAVTHSLALAVRTLAARRTPRDPAPIASFAACGHTLLLAEHNGALLLAVPLARSNLGEAEAQLATILASAW